MGHRGSYTHYSEAEDALILANPDATTESLVALLATLGNRRDMMSVRHRRRRLGVAIAKPEWLEAETERLRVLWVEQKLTSAEIARLWPEKSRSAINGKSVRMGWPRTAAQSTSHTAKPPALPKAARNIQHGGGCVIDMIPKDPRPVRMIGPLPGSRDLPMWHREFGGCRYPTSGDDAPEHLFCCLPTEEGANYCRDHARRCGSSVPVKGPKSAKEFARSLRRYVA